MVVVVVVAAAVASAARARFILSLEYQDLCIFYEEIFHAPVSVLLKFDPNEDQANTRTNTSTTAPPTPPRPDLKSWNWKVELRQFWRQVEATFLELKKHRESMDPTIRHRYAYFVASFFVDRRVSCVLTPETIKASETLAKMTAILALAETCRRRHRVDVAKPMNSLDHTIAELEGMLLRQKEEVTRDSEAKPLSTATTAASSMAATTTTTTTTTTNVPVVEVVVAAASVELTQATRPKSSRTPKAMEESKHMAATPVIRHATRPVPVPMQVAAPQYQQIHQQAATAEPVDEVETYVTTEITFDQLATLGPLPTRVETMDIVEDAGGK